MTRIADIPLEARPRERAWRLGINSLETAELLALVIGSGVERHSALDIGYQLTMGRGGLLGLLRYGPQDFLSIPGINKATAVKLLAVCEISRRMQKDRSEEPLIFRSANQVFEMYHLWLGTLDHEKMIMLMLNHQNRLIREKIIYQGTGQKVNLSLRDLYVELFSHNAHKFILVHNHPGGNHEPSQEDITTTIAIKREALKLGLTLVDHVIISDQGYFSMNEHEILY
ncbi:MAG: DNA repair protein RadC [Bacilli bacterium]|jgi:DNA repair protein RadC